MQTIKVKETSISVIKFDESDYISLTDIAKYKSSDPNSVIGNWLRNRNTVEYLGVWETLYNSEFNPIEFEGFRKEAGLNAFTLSPTKWIERTNAIGLFVRSGRYGGTYPSEVYEDQVNQTERMSPSIIITTFLISGLRA